MKDLEPLPYRYRHILGRIVPPDEQVVETSKLISSAFDDVIYSMFIKPYIKAYHRVKSKRIK
jgi:hypothetical protein